MYPLYGKGAVFGSDDTPALGPRALPTFRQFTCRGALSLRCRPGPSPRKPVEVNGTNSPAGTCLGRLLPPEGMGRSLISILCVARAWVRGQTSAGEGADVAAPHRAVEHLVGSDGSPSAPARAVAGRALEPPSCKSRSGGTVAPAGQSSPGRVRRAEVAVAAARPLAHG